MNVGYGARKDRPHWATSAHHARDTALTRCSRHLVVMRVYRWPKPRQIKSAIYHCTVCIVVLDAQKIDHPDQPILCVEGTECRHWTRSPRRSNGSARRSLASMRSATSSLASSPNWKRPNVCSRATPRAPGQQRWPQRRRGRQQRKQLLQRGHADAGVLRPENQLAASAAHRPWGIRSLPWQPAKRSKKSPLHAKALAQTTSASFLPDTNGLAASKSVTGNSTPNSQPGRNKVPRSDTGR